MLVNNIETTQKRIKILETLSLMCAIIPAAFMVMKFILIGLGVGLMLQVWIYLSYKSIGEEGKYLRNKMGAILGGVLIIGYLIIKNNVFA